MPSLSTPIGELKAHYDVVVVGSGYGASVAAYRMAEAAEKAGQNGQPAFSVCVLERGLEIRAGDYPSSFVRAVRQMQVDSPLGHVGSATGLFDMRVNRDVGVLVGCGLGGGSLINAGVMLTPTPTVLTDNHWPAAIRAQGLANEFQTVSTELDVSPLPKKLQLPKVSQLFEAAALSPSPTPGIRPPIAVSFRTQVNRHQVQQQACVLCGDCMTGCNHSAKNTLVMNYLPGAAQAGAAIFCQMDVRAIERHHDRWHVHVRVLNPGFRMFETPELTIQANAVFLGAGTLGSTEILLRSNRRGLTVSPQLGRRFSGNGDVIAFAYNAPTPVNGFGYGTYVPPDAAVGPLIGGMVDERDRPSGAMIQEGAVPGALVPILRFAAPLMARVSYRPADNSTDLLFRPFWRELDTVLRGVRHGALPRTQTFLGMGRDNAAGVMRLSQGRLRIDWPKRCDDDVIPRITRRMADFTKAMRARYLVNPFWVRVFGRRRMTVHPLGGACMADRADDGVVDADGRVFADASGTRVHDGLYVCDGSVVPLALGTNPALTISALAERIARHAVAPVQRLVARAPARATRPGRVRPSVPGIHYAERLSGSIRFDGVDSRFVITLHISAESVSALIDNPLHQASIVGVLHAPALPPHRRRFTVSEGTFNVMVDDSSRVDSKLIRYAMKLTAADGSEFWWRGVKTINYDTARRGPWRVLSSYAFTVRDPTGKKVAAGIARSSVLDALRLAASIRITNERRWRERWRLRASYRKYFLGSVMAVVGRKLSSAPPANPFEQNTELSMPPDIKPGEVLTDKKRLDRPRYTLRSYTSLNATDRKGPVILAPGFGMSSYAFRLPPSLTEYLCREGYQVWLLDYRASDRLAASLEQFTLDDLAVGGNSLGGDFPDAVEQVFVATGQRVQIVAHCVASLTVFMALLSRTLNERLVRSVVLSQSFACINHPWINRFKAWIRLPQFLRYMRFMTIMTPDYDLRSGWQSRLLDRLLRVYPTNEPCSSGVCRRLLLMYGEVIRHDQLEKGTHDIVHDLFDRANMSTFVHLSLMILKGRIVDSEGRDTYLTPENTSRINVPITLLQGKGNRLFKPRGARRTYQWLQTYGGHGSRNAEMFRLESVDGHGHLDMFIGKNAPKVVYPKIAELLAAGVGAAAEAQAT